MGLKVFSGKQGPIVGAALAGLTGWYYAGAREGNFLPEPSAESLGLWTGLIVALVITFLTRDDPEPPQQQPPPQPSAVPPPSTGATP